MSGMVAELARLRAAWEASETGDPRLFEAADMRDIALDDRPLVLLGACSAYAQDFAAQSEPGRIVGAIDQKAAGGDSLAGVPIETDAALPSLCRRHPGMIALLMAESVGADRHFRGLCKALELPVLGPLHAFRRTGFAMTDVLGMLYNGLTETSLARRADWDDTASLFADAASREIFAAIMLFRLSLDRRYIEHALALSEASPRPPWLGDPVRHDHVFFDGGAFDGDTVASFLAKTGGRYRRIFAVEPDPDTFLRLEARFGAEAGIDCIEAALSAEPGKLRFAAGAGHASSLSESGAVWVAVETIDRIATDRLTALKLDIEGAEAAALQGGAGQLRDNRPGLAIAAYHHPADLFDLPRLIGAMASGYRFYLRHHTPWAHDTVLYASC